MSSQDKQTLLDQITADIKTNNICPDLAENATNLVMGDGNVDAEIVFIGEAPGKNEDEQGLPFVGAAGKFLNEMLAGINLTRSDVYITNIVKYRPPHNRDPLPDEKKAFWPYLVSQLDIIKPKLVVTLGRHSMEYFLPDLKISLAHGQPKRIKFFYGRGLVGGKKYAEGASEPSTQQTAATQKSAAKSVGEQFLRSVVILPLYHPAAALYNGSMRETLVEDFSKIPKIIEQISA